MRGWFYGQYFRVELAGELADLTLVADFTFFALYGTIIIYGAFYMCFMVFALLDFSACFYFKGWMLLS